jgi:PAS domain-containing protein
MLSKLIANIGDVIVVIDREGNNTYKSPNIERLFGWKSEDVLGRVLLKMYILTIWKLHNNSLPHSHLSLTLSQQLKLGTGVKMVVINGLKLNAPIFCMTLM